MAQTGDGKNKKLTDMMGAAFSRGLGSLRTEIEEYKNEADIWKVADGITNSGGNLCLHIVGNLNHFVGANLGNTGYIRKRDLEFSDKDLSKVELLKRVDDVAGVVEQTFAELDDDKLADDYPEVLLEKQMDSGTVLAYMSGHLMYHLGQLNYHRRLLDS